MKLPAHSELGVTLVELLVSIVVVSIAASAVLGVISMNTARSADPMILHQAAAIAESYIEEVLLKPASDPDGVDGEAAVSYTHLTLPTITSGCRSRGWAGQ